MTLINDIKQRISNKLSEDQKIYLRFSQNVISRQYTIRKCLNLLWFDKNKFKKEYISYSLPVYDLIITRKCNLHCPTCYYLLSNSHSPSNNFIDPEQLRSVLKKFNPDGKALVIFLTGGEPLLHPQLDQIIDICRQTGAQVNISTNGILVKDHINELQKCDYVNISLDSYDEETFRKYRRGNEFQFRNIIDGLKSIKNKKYSLSFVLSTENVTDAPKMLDFSASVNTPMVYFHNINPHGSNAYHPLLLSDSTVRKVLHDITLKTDYPFDIYISTIFDPASDNFKKEKCAQPWFFCCFDMDGDIALCCHLEPDKKNGNVFKGDDYNSPAMRAYRRKIMTQHEETNPHCTYCQRRFMSGEFGKFVKADKKWYTKNF